MRDPEKYTWHRGTDERWNRKQWDLALAVVRTACGVLTAGALIWRLWR